jgi:hypothetical protein
MINVTPGGGGAGKSGGGGPGIGTSGFLSLGSFYSGLSRGIGRSMSAGRNLIKGGYKGASAYSALSSGDIVGMVGSNNLYKKYGINTAELVGKNPSNIIQLASRYLGIGGAQAETAADILTSGTKGGKYLVAAVTSSKYLPPFVPDVSISAAVSA